MRDLEVMETRRGVSGRMTERVGMGSKQEKGPREEVESKGKKVTCNCKDIELVEELMDKIRSETREQLEGERKRLEEEFKAYRDHMEKKWEGWRREAETEMESMGKEINECRDRIREWESWMGNKNGSGERSSQSDTRREHTSNRRECSILEEVSGDKEDRLSRREVNKIKNLVAKKEKEERKCNIVVRGMGIGEDMERNKEKVAKLIRDKVRVNCRITRCWRSGGVLIAKIENEEKKWEILQNKYRLKGEQIFIDSDLSWEERKIQERINRWAKEQRGKGREVKVGKGRVKVGGRWKKWEEIEQKEGKEREEKEEREKGRGIGGDKGSKEGTKNTE